MNQEIADNSRACCNCANATMSYPNCSCWQHKYCNGDRPYVIPKEAWIKTAEECKEFELGNPEEADVYLELHRIMSEERKDKNQKPIKYIDADKLINEIQRRKKQDTTIRERSILIDIETAIASLQQEQEDMGEVSDGYHTFNELYYYRMLYNAAFFNLLPKEWVHKSKRHHTGEECFGGGWFIVMANLPTGQVSNHYELKDWDLFKVPEKEIADEWDGHTPQEAAERLKRYLQQEQPDNWSDEYREDELLTRFAFYTYKDEDGVLYLSNVFVEETSRNKGFGAKILQAAEKVAETIGANTIRLKAKRNSQANDWYRKHGYGYLTFEGEYDWLEKNLEYLKPKQEPPEVDLEEEITDKSRACCNCVNGVTQYPNCFCWQHEYCNTDEPYKIPKEDWVDTAKTCKKFELELGLNARKEE